jgi:vacuolar-type H+-ATPase subunit I/STV1
MNCKFCEKPLPDEKTGKRPREYCNNAHRQAHYRRLHPPIRGAKPDIVLASTLNEAQARITELEQQVAELQKDLALEQSSAQEQIKELEQQAMRLHNRLDLERRYYESKQYSFKAWLKKQPQTEFTQRILADQLFMPRDTRAHYEYYMRRVKYSQEDMQAFADLWRLMLLFRD